MEGQFEPCFESVGCAANFGCNGKPRTERAWCRQVRTVAPPPPVTEDLDYEERVTTLFVRGCGRIVMIGSGWHSCRVYGAVGLLNAVASRADQHHHQSNSFKSAVLRMEWRRLERRGGSRGSLAGVCPIGVGLHFAQKHLSK